MSGAVMTLAAAAQAGLLQAEPQPLPFAVRRAQTQAAERRLLAEHPDLRPWVKATGVDHIYGRLTVDVETDAPGGVRVWAAALGGTVTEHHVAYGRVRSHHAETLTEHHGVQVRIHACRMAVTA